MGYTNRLSIIVLLMFAGLSCRTDKPATPDLTGIELLRGDVVMCSGVSFGDVSFASACGPAVREDFNLAIALLHSFEYPEAEKAFVRVLDVDPECAMAYWGVAMSIYHAAWSPPGEADLSKASQILSAASSLTRSSREADYLAAIGAYYHDYENVPHHIRSKNYGEAMAAVYEKYPADTEAAVFYALALYSTRDRSGKAYVNERKAGQILESIFPDQPNHPGVAHYLIHNYDNPELAELALPTARMYAAIAPGSAHAQHMPSHIFTRLGLWEESITSNLASMSAAQCYAEETDNPTDHWGEVHAMDYLMYAYLQRGDNTNAAGILDHLNSMDTFSNVARPYSVAAIPARMVLENRDWEGAANLRLRATNISWADTPWEVAILHFTRALGAVNTGDTVAAQAELIALKKLRDQLLENEQPYYAEQVAVQVETAAAWIDFMNGSTEAALLRMRAAADLEDNVGKHPQTPGEVLPGRELLGDMLLQAERPAEALVAYEESLRSHPGRFNGLYGAAVAAIAVGNEGKARMYFQQLLDGRRDVRSNRLEIREAGLYLREETFTP